MPPSTYGIRRAKASLGTKMAPQAEFKLWEEESDEWQELSPIACRQPRRRNPCRPFPGWGWAQGGSCCGCGSGTYRTRPGTKYLVEKLKGQVCLKRQTERERKDSSFDKTTSLNVTHLWGLQPTANCPCDRCSLVITEAPLRPAPLLSCCKVIGPAAGKAGPKARSRPELSIYGI
jgi:hypothetical protein